MLDSLYLIPLMPLIGFVVNFFLAERLPKKLTASIACGSVAISFVLSVLAFQGLSSLPESNRVIEQVWFSWMNLGSLSVDFAFLLDPLSAVMILVVTGVGLLIHIYSIGYMS
ncbi:MAG: NADH-quinone oxidoreductase subunit L, partial [candidate division Zixibacteria bacterium]|nr:NADH-quinone oxidoreductase subunit L [candidate division Zixibacteria bacterium]